MQNSSTHATTTLQDDASRQPASEPVENSDHPRSARASRPTDALIASQAHRFFLWVPVCFGAGIAAYFALPFEPSVQLALGAIIGSVCGYILFLRRPGLAILTIAIVWIGLGFAIAKFRTLLIEHPTISKEMRPTTIVGWVERVETRTKGERILLRLKSVERLQPSATPFRARIQNNIKETLLTPGALIEMRAVLRPLPEPVRPKGFDFARRAWFQKIGAVGYTLSRPTTIARPGASSNNAPVDILLRSQIERVRKNISERVREALPGQLGTIADALITGNRGGIAQQNLDMLRRSGLAHILAISGLHMALMAGSLFWLLRALLALVPALALSLPIKKIAAAAALLGGLGYLLLSGSSHSTIRAFTMISVMFAAILLGREAISLRNVAISALIILILWPEALFDVGFQMSFAAVTALIAFNEWRLARRTYSSEPALIPPRTGIFQIPFAAAKYIGALALTTIVASTAISPFAAYHFHKVALFGLAANILAMPLVVSMVMPAALASLIAMPFGLEKIPLNIMGDAINLVLAVAQEVQALDGAVKPIAAISPLSLGLITLGGLWSFLWVGRVRLFGFALILAGLGAAPFSKAPDLLIERDAKTFAIRNEAGQLTAPKRAAGSYSLQQWLQADGDMRTLKEVKNGAGYRCDEIACIAKVKDKIISFILHPAALEEDCTRGDIIIVTWPIYRACATDALIIDRSDLREKGAHALFIENEKIIVTTAADYRGDRPWTKARRNK